jgi:hypothetical protein
MQIRLYSTLFFYIALIYQLLLSCSNIDKQVTSNDFIKWIENEENGLIITKKISSIKYTLFYKPAEYLALNEMKLFPVDSLKLREFIREYNNLYFFSLKIEDINGKNPLLINSSSPEEYQTLLQYCSFDMQKDLKLILCEDTLDCVFYHFESDYLLSSFSTLSFGFDNLYLQERPDQNCDLVLWYNDHIFKTGYIFLKITKDNIKKIPQISLDYDSNHS